MPGMKSGTATTVASASSRLATYCRPSRAAATASALPGIDRALVWWELAELTSEPSASKRNRLSSCFSATVRMACSNSFWARRPRRLSEGIEPSHPTLPGHLLELVLQPRFPQSGSHSQGGGEAVAESEHVGALPERALSSLSGDERRGERGQTGDQRKREREPPAEADVKAAHTRSLGRFARRAGCRAGLRLAPSATSSQIGSLPGRQGGQVMQLMPANALQQPEWGLGRGASCGGALGPGGDSRRVSERIFRKGRPAAHSKGRSFSECDS